MRAGLRTFHRLRLLFRGSLRGLAACWGRITLLGAVKIVDTTREIAACGFGKKWASGDLWGPVETGWGGVLLWAASCDHVQKKHYR